MNYLKIGGITAALWVLSAGGVYALWGKIALHGTTYGALACLSAALGGEMTRIRFVKLFPDGGSAFGFLAGGAVRTLLLVVFLLFSIRIYQYPLDKSFVLSIIGSYFVYYPALLAYSVRSAVRSVQILEKQKQDGKNSELNRI